jgi:hypothetical protein
MKITQKNKLKVKRSTKKEKKQKDFCQVFLNHVNKTKRNKKKKTKVNKEEI